jgi:hypothetical protein
MIDNVEQDNNNRRKKKPLWIRNAAERQDTRMTMELFYSVNVKNYIHPIDKQLCLSPVFDMIRLSAN